MRNQGNNPTFFLSNLTLEDQGMYSCRASWDVKSQTHSVISTNTPAMVQGEFLPPNTNVQIQLVRSANTVFLFQKFCPNQFWRLKSTLTRFPAGWGSFATTNTTFLLLPLRCIFISTRTITDWDQPPLRTSCWSDRLRAGTAVRSGFLPWIWSGGVSSKALDKCQVFRDSTAHPDNEWCEMLDNGNKPPKTMLCLIHRFNPYQPSPAASSEICSDPFLSFASGCDQAVVCRSSSGQLSPLHLSPLHRVAPQPNYCPRIRQQLRSIWGPFRWFFRRWCPIRG